MAIDGRGAHALCLQFFDFHTTALEATMAMSSSITALSLHRDSGLLAVTCDDLAIRLVDIETRRVVREMAGFRGRILDLVSLWTFWTDACRADRGALF